MTKKKNGNFAFRARSLRWAMLYALTLGLCLAVMTFLVVRAAFSAYIENIYLSEERVEARESSIVRELQEYVTDRNLSSGDTAELARWTRSNKYLYVMIYKDDFLFFESGDYEDEEETIPGEGEEKPGEAPEEGGDGGEGSEEDENSGSTLPGMGITTTRPTREELIKYAAENDSHLLTLSDGEVLVSMADFSEYLYYDLTGIISIVAAMIALIIVIMIYYGGVTRRITRLARAVSETAEGNINRTIRGDGVDEIGHLAENVEYMRSSIVENLEKEKAARAANLELITSMSHDIRTPLTVLLGYLDMMKGRNTDEEMAEYINASERTALRMKELSDGMFNYFLVFGGGVSKTPLASHDASILFEQLLSEFDLLFREKGYTVLRKTTEAAAAAFSGYDILTDAPEAMRVVENIFSNIGKYADKEQPVEIEIDFKDGKYQLKFTNTVAKDLLVAESNGVGLKTCRKLAERIFSSFEAEREGEMFVARIELFTEAGV